MHNNGYRGYNIHIYQLAWHAVNDENEVNNGEC